MDCLRAFGKIPDINEQLTILVKVGSKITRLSFTSHVGKASRLHDLLGNHLMIFSTSDSV